MQGKELAGKIQTVIGVIDPEMLGVTLFHEHLLVDMSTFFFEPEGVREKELAYLPISLENLHWVRTHRINNLDNLQLSDEEVAIKEALLFKEAGGGTIVEMSSIGMSRDPLGLARISRATGLNVIMGCGYYVGTSHPPDLKDKNIEDIAQGIIHDITEGVDGTGVCAGVIGEVGCSFPLNDTERNVLRASVIAQQETGAAMIIHPGPDDDLALEIIRILNEAGADQSRTVISHMDIMGYSKATRQKILEAGCYVGYDCFGHLGFPHLMHDRLLTLTGDLERVKEIIQVIEDGFLERILVAQDHCFKDCLTTYGGYGYAHILNNVLNLMRNMGMTEEQIRTIMVENPKRLFQFAS